MRSARHDNEERSSCREIDRKESFEKSHSKSIDQSKIDQSKLNQNDRR